MTKMTQLTRENGYESQERMEGFSLADDAEEMSRKMQIAKLDPAAKYDSLKEELRAMKMSVHAQAILLYQTWHYCASTGTRLYLNYDAVSTRQHRTCMHRAAKLLASSVSTTETCELCELPFRRGKRETSPFDSLEVLHHRHVATNLSIRGLACSAGRPGEALCNNFPSFRTAHTF